MCHDPVGGWKSQVRAYHGAMLPDYAEFEQAIGLDWYAMDPNLSFLLDRYLPDRADRAFAEDHVSRFGSLVGRVIAPRAEETDKHGPALRRYDRWGYDVDEIVHNDSWTQNKADLVRNGFVSLESYAGRPAPAVVGASLSYLVSQAETAIYCGLGMTSGAADIIERHNKTDVGTDMVSRLRSIDPTVAWEGGMFLTERQGGSDVGANTMRAVEDGEEWRLFGDKHFCSNVDADVFIVLARPDGAPAGSRGLGTFIVPRHLPDGSPNGFSIKRLKPKLGTVGVPTGEVHLDGAVAWLAGTTAAASDPDPGPADGSRTDAARDGRGINRMMEMVNGSRFGVALMGLGIHRRSFLEAAIYAARRSQFGHRIDAYPLVRETLVDLLVDLEAGMGVTYECAAAERTASDVTTGRLVRRILVPLAKMRCTRMALQAASTALEVFGGNGYMEDWPMARQLRDAQCHTIWEGTENILCIDVRRAMRGEQAHLALLARMEQALDTAAGHKILASTVDTVAAAVADARAAAIYLESAADDLALLQSRRLAELLGDAAEGALLVEQAAFALEADGDARKAAVAHRFATRHLATQPLRGITDPDRLVLDQFEPLVRYGPISPSDLAA
jgi:alkylation response protein AidB-like acyl-CoA dehydrogenase